MSDDLTPVGSAAVRLALRTVRLRRERDRARDLAVALEQRMARVETLLVEAERGEGIVITPGFTTYHCVETGLLRAALEVEP